MTAERFEELVRRLELEAERRPGLYRLRVAALAALGYAYILAVLALVLVILALCVLGLSTGKAAAAFLKFGWVLGAMGWSIVRSLWVRLDPPQGLVLAPSEAPALFECVERIRRRLGAPRPHVVQIDGQINASVTQVPRLGVLGWQRNYLTLGLPLLQALSSAEAQAVIAHEFGHLAGAHGRFGAWIYRLRISWGQLLARFESRQGMGAAIFRRFASWYAPIFNAYTFVQARKQEIEADRMSVECSSRRSAADALLRLEIASHRLAEEFWPSIDRRVRSEASPPANLYAELGAVASPTADPQPARAAIDRALAHETSLDDTHPCLRDRLALLGVEARVPEAVTSSAASELLGGALARVERHFSESWRSGVDERWRAGHEAARAERARLAELEAELARHELAPEQAWERAVLLWNEHRRAEADAVIEKLAATAPDFLPAQHAHGHRLLERGDERGLEHLERALAGPARDAIEACHSAWGFLSERGRTDEAARWAERARALAERLEQRQAERDSFEAMRDAVEPHGLDDAAIARLAEQLSRVAELRDAWLVRKRLQYSPDEPVFVLAVRTRARWSRIHTAIARLRQGLTEAVTLPGEWFILALDIVPKRGRESILRAAGPAVFRHR